jgi:hypothetical protein
VGVMKSDSTNFTRRPPGTATGSAAQSRADGSARTLGA